LRMGNDLKNKITQFIRGVKAMRPFRRRDARVIMPPDQSMGKTQRQKVTTAEGTFDAYDFNDAGMNEKAFVVPSWFRRYFGSDENSKRYWEWQYQLAKEGKDHALPDDRMRMPANELHQLMAKSFIDELLASSHNDFETVLDVGCSDGYIVHYFNSHGKKAVGVNDAIYPTDRLYIEENNLTIFEMDMHHLKFDDSSFDAVWCRHSLEHSFAPLQVIAEIYRVLKKGGKLFMILPPPPNPPVPYHGHWHQIPDYQLKYLLEMCNFMVLSLNTVWFSYKRENDNLEIRAVCRKE